MQLQTDRHSFPIVNNLDELRLAKTAGHPQVKATCPGCEKVVLIHTGQVEFLWEFKCLQHGK